jgi:hypothetical protein
MKPIQEWFGIEGIHLGWATVHVQKNDLFGSWCVV